MLPVILYEPYYRTRFFPLHSYQPLWEVRTGALKTRERLEHKLGTKAIYLFPPAHLHEVSSSFSPKSQVISEENLPQEAIFVSSALLMSPEFDVFKAAESDLTYHCKRFGRDEFLELSLSGILDVPTDAEGGSFIIIRNPWDIINNLDRLIRWDNGYFKNAVESGNLNVVGPEEHLYISGKAKVLPQVVFDTTNGPIVVSDYVEIQPFSHLLGPLFIGKKTIVLGGKLAASSFGENCRVSGEVSNSVFQDFVNKAHAGFIGHSYLGHFTNLGAMTTNSNLKNTYGNIRLKMPDRILETNVNKFGMICGPHTKFGIGSLIPTGSLIGGFCNLFAGGSFVPKFVNHFTWYNGKEEKTYRFDQAVKTASLVAARRDRDFTAAETKVALSVYRKVYTP